MHRPLEDHAKRRLIEPKDIAMAVGILQAEGFAEDELLDEMTKLFYVDLDAFNFVLKHERRYLQF